MAGRQLPDRRRAAARDPRRPSPGLLPGAPEAGRRPPRGIPARHGACLGVHRPHRQPLRPGEPSAHGPRLPGRGAADDRRAVGDRDQPADPPRREPPPPRGGDRAEPGSPPAGGPARRSPAGPGPRGSGDRTDLASPLGGGAPHRRAGRALPAPPRPGPGGHPGRPLARGAPGVPGDHGRGDGPPGAPAPGDDERHGPQRDHEHAPDLVVRLGPVRRERQRRRRGPAGRQPVRGDGLRDARSIPARHRGACARGRPDRDRGRPPGRGDDRGRPRGSAGPRPLPDRRRAPRARAGAGRPGAAGRAAAPCLRPEGDGELHRDPCHGHGPAPGRPDRAVVVRRRGGHRRRPRGHPRARSRLRPRGRARQLGRHQRSRPEAAATAGPRQRRAVGAANPRRGPDAPLERGRCGGPGQRPRGALPRQPRG